MRSSGVFVWFLDPGYFNEGQGRGIGNLSNLSSTNVVYLP